MEYYLCRMQCGLAKWLAIKSTAWVNVALHNSLVLRLAAAWQEAASLLGGQTRVF